jgi:hypothetical protein
LVGLDELALVNGFFENSVDDLHLHVLVDRQCFLDGVPTDTFEGSWDLKGESRAEQKV